MNAQTRQTHLDPLAITLLLLCCFLWGINQVAAKAALTEISPLWQAGLRSAVAGVLVWLWSVSRGVRLFERDASLWGGLLAGALFAAEFACIFVGLQYTSASRMVVFIYLSPFVVALGMPWIAHGEKLSAGQWAGLVLAFGAVAFAFAEGFSASSPTQWWGDALGVAAAMLWGGTTLAIRGTKLSSAPAEKTLLYQLGVSAIALCAAAMFAGEPLPLHWSPRLLGLFGFQAVIVSFASYLAWFWLIRHYAATKLAVFTLSTPLFGLLAGALLLGEGISPRLVAALAALAAGIVLVNR
ncbi:MAG: DMT family transporter [Burkholderiales bacterium]|jgi:drug/metabolite transporter (DMT)-like permease|nr:DMT family transporter [Burkholderiales bacterium]